MLPCGNLPQLHGHDDRLPRFPLSWTRMKGHRDFDVEKAYEACKRSSAYDSTGIAPAVLSPIGKRYKNSIGYIPSDKDRTSVSKGLEYAYNDWLIAQFAKDRGEEADFHHYSKLGKHYVHYFDSAGVHEGNFPMARGCRLSAPASLLTIATIARVMLGNGRGSYLTISRG